MGFEFLEHEADMGIKAWAGNEKDLFREGAKALFNVICDSSTVETKKKVPIKVQADSVELAFIEFINEIVSQSGLKEMFFSDCKVSNFEKENNKIIVEAELSGENIDLDKHHPKVEVKAATYSGLRYEEENGKHVIQCLLDV